MCWCVRAALSTCHALLTCAWCCDCGCRSAAPAEGAGAVNPDCFGPGWSVMRRMQFVLFQLIFVMQFVIVGM